METKSIRRLTILEWIFFYPTAIDIESEVVSTE
jgi:hypothetical protein